MLEVLSHEQETQHDSGLTAFRRVSDHCETPSRALHHPGDGKPLKLRPRVVRLSQF